MDGITLKQFKEQLNHLANIPVINTHDITPWLYDIIEHLGETGDDLHNAIKTLAKCLNFFEITHEEGTPLFHLECRSFNVFSHVLKVKHADSIEMFRVTNTCMRSVNNTLVSTFAELSNELMFSDLDNNVKRSKYTDALITIIKLAYAGGLPLAAALDFNDFISVDSTDIQYDVVYTHRVLPYILRMEGDDYYLYVNSLNNRSIRLAKDVSFNMIYLLAILKTCSPTDRLTDMAFYGVDGAEAYAIMDMVNKEVI